MSQDLSLVRLVHCTRGGCPAVHRDNKFAAIRAKDAGWFRSRETGESFCPAHLPDWVPAWRAKKAAEQFGAEGAYSALPAILKCEQGDLADVVQPVPDEDAWKEALKELRARAFEHARLTGHACTVTDSRMLTVSPVSQQ